MSRSTGRGKTTWEIEAEGALHLLRSHQCASDSPTRVFWRNVAYLVIASI